MQVDGIEVFIEGAGPPIVMVHGWPDTHRLWDGQVEALKDCFRCVRFTLPGFDVSKPRRAYSVDEVVETLRPRIETRRLEFVRRMDSDIPNVMADADMVKQILSNLLENAIKYTPENGRVTVSTTGEGAMVLTEVADTGVGIARQHLPHVFERFYKVERSRREGGTGLGLAIVKHIVQAHGGDVRVESVEGTGSTFSFSLPAAG